jgi:peptidoglycan hydrolase-like protein with peptidoglycan-binding domain
MKLFELLGIAGSALIMEQAAPPAGFVPVEIDGYTIFVSPDYVRGEDGNYQTFGANSAQAYAYSRGAIVPTSGMASAIAERSRLITMPTQPIGQTGGTGDPAVHTREATRRIQQAGVDAGSLVAGHMKDVVQSTNNNRLGLWGGYNGSDFYQSGGSPHGNDYSDYSQGLRLVHRFARDPEGNLVELSSPAMIDRFNQPQPATEVRRAQVLLNQLGYDVGNIDGAMGPNTRSALNRFQTEQGIDPTDDITPDTLQSLQQQTLQVLPGPEPQAAAIPVPPAIDNNPVELAPTPAVATAPPSASPDFSRLSAAERNAVMVYHSLRQAGFSDTQAQHLTGEVHRENGFRSNLLFGTHSDPANNATNLGMISWQGPRQPALLDFMRDLERREGVELFNADGSLRRTQDVLNAQAQFLRQEMETNSHGGSATQNARIQQWLANPNPSDAESRDIVGGDFIRWALNNNRYRSSGLRNRTDGMQILDRSLERLGDTYVPGADYDFDAVRFSSPTEDPSVLRLVQTQLNNLGFDTGLADGVFGPNTRRGIEQFQRDQGLDVTGIPDMATVDAVRQMSVNARVGAGATTARPLTQRPTGPMTIQPSGAISGSVNPLGFATPRAPINRNELPEINVNELPAPGGTLLRAGSRGADVRDLQTTLSNLGYDLGDTGVDGVYGRRTANAVRNFQRDYGLQTDGIVGRQTVGALRQLLPEPTELPEPVSTRSAAASTGGPARYPAPSQRSDAPAPSTGGPARYPAPSQRSDAPERLPRPEIQLPDTPTPSPRPLPRPNLDQPDLNTDLPPTADRRPSAPAPDTVASPTRGIDTPGVPPSRPNLTAPTAPPAALPLNDPDRPEFADPANDLEPVNRRLESKTYNILNKMKIISERRKKI